jgi:succinate-acetate transporter protein
MAKKFHEAAHNENPPRATSHAYDYGGNPLAHIHSSDSARLPAFGGAAQPGLYKPPKTQIANPAPLGLAGFALTTFLLSCVNLGVRGLSAPTIVIAPALVYGGFIQLLAGMWEIAVGEFFGVWSWHTPG